MPKTGRLYLLLLLAGLLLLLALAFLPFLMANVIMPLATVVWLLLRIFVLSIDQHVYWWALISLIVLLALIRLLRVSTSANLDQLPEANPAIASLQQWRHSIVSNVHEQGEPNFLKQGLRRLVVAMHTTRRQGAATFTVEEALERREILLPDHVYTFLFARKTAVPRPNFFRHPVAAGQWALQSCRLALARSIRRRNGRAAAEYYQAIDEALSLMEASLEIKHDSKPDNTPDH